MAASELRTSVEGARGGLLSLTGIHNCGMPVMVVWFISDAQPPTAGALSFDLEQAVKLREAVDSCIRAMQGQL